jgi:hypothetical protein
MEHFKVTNQVEHTSGLSCSKNSIVAASAPEISQGHQTDLYLHYKKVSLCLYKEHLHVQKQEKTHCLTDLCKEYTIHRTTNSY